MTTPLAPTDLLDLRLIGQIDVSPDGSLVAFIQAEYDTDADETVWSIWTVPTDGSAEPEQLTSGARRDSMPRWSPDGESIAFLSAREAAWRTDLHVVDVADGKTRTAAVLARGIQAFAWNPTSDGFAVVGKPPYPDDPHRPTEEEEQRRRRYLERVIHVDRLDYRSSSHWFDDEASQLWWVPLDGQPVMLTSGEGDVSAPAWTPDGRIAFRRATDPGDDDDPHAQVWTVGIDGGEPEALTEPVNALRGFSVSAGGSVAYVGLPVHDWSFGSHDPHLFVDGEDVSGSLDRPVSRASEVQSLTLDYLTATDSPLRAPDGTVYFLVVDAGCCHVYRLDGRTPVPVVTGKRVVGDVSFGGSTLAFTATSPSEANALWVSDLDGGNERLLYDPNPWLRERAVGEIRHLPVTLDDGTEMDAWAVLPADHDGSALPAILDIHPGPHSSFPWDYRFDHRVLANAGYVVLSCNQPGSQGYGEAYASILDGRWGEADLPGYIATCDEAVRQGLADGDRLGVTGATYGAFAALWALAHRDRFKAAVTNRAMVDFEAMYGDSDIGWSFLPASLGAEPWEDPDLYRRISLLTYIERIEAPVRLLAFSDNGRITVAQSEAVYRRLKKLGTTTDLLVFPPGSQTVLMPNRPWSKVQMYAALLEWFDRHL